MTRVEYTKGFEYLMGQVGDGFEAAAEADEIPSSSENVRPLHAEGTRNGKDPGRSARTYHRNPLGQGWNVLRLVEPIGLEPTTSCLQSRRSTN